MNLNIDQIESSYVVPADRTNGYADVRAYWVPMKYYEDVLKAYRDAGIKIRPRFRGSRIQSVGREMPCIGSDRTYRRTRNQANQDCLKADATHFTIYGRR